MCDTVVVVDREGVLFAKSSDRDPNEPQLLEWHAAKDHANDTVLACTHLAIEQAPHTNAILISRPAWMWGAEIGANEHGVVIGNEAVFTREKYGDRGLTGMDMLRLALERADSAERATHVIVELLERYGQGGGAGFEDPSFTYHNAFLIADRHGAFVLETAGPMYAIEKVTHGARSISNGLTIPHFAAAHADKLRGRVAACAARQKRTTALAEGTRDVRGMMRLLRDHGPGRSWPEYAMTNGSMRAPCMHGGGVIAAAQTTASWVSALSKTAEEEAGEHWVTATSAPCLSLFKPVHVKTPIFLAEPRDLPDTESLFWQHERLHRRVMRAPEKLAPLFLSERAEVEAAWIQEPPSTKDAFEKHAHLLRTWTARVSKERVRDERPAWARRYWRARDRIVGV